jgi:hypothetical protein
MASEKLKGREQNGKLLSNQSSLGTTRRISLAVFSCPNLSPLAHGPGKLNRSYTIGVTEQGGLALAGVPREPGPPPGAGSQAKHCTKPLILRSDVAVRVAGRVGRGRGSIADL